MANGAAGGSRERTRSIPPTVKTGAPALHRWPTWRSLPRQAQRRRYPATGAVERSPSDGAPPPLPSSFGRESRSPPTIRRVYSNSSLVIAFAIPLINVASITHPYATSPDAAGDRSINGGRHHPQPPTWRPWFTRSVRGGSKGSVGRPSAVWCRRCRLTAGSTDPNLLRFAALVLPPTLPPSPMNRRFSMVWAVVQVLVG